MSENVITESAHKTINYPVTHFSSLLVKCHPQGSDPTRKCVLWMECVIFLHLSPI